MNVHLSFLSRVFILNSQQYLLLIYKNIVNEQSMGGRGDGTRGVNKLLLIHMIVSNCRVYLKLCGGLKLAFYRIRLDRNRNYRKITLKN